MKTFKAPDTDKFLFRSFDPNQKCPVSCYVKKLGPGVMEDNAKLQF